MIFLTVGSDTPFNRLVKAFDEWCICNSHVDAFAQIGNIGPHDYVPSAVRWTKILDSDQFAKVHNAAQLIVAHAGIGSILTALSTSKPIVVMPRRAAFYETRNDHQLATAVAFNERPNLFIAWNEADLSDTIQCALNLKKECQTPPLSPYAPESLTGRLRTFILGPNDES